jgi:flagellar motor switch protein FliN
MADADIQELNPEVAEELFQRADALNLQAVYDIPVEITVVLGSAKMSVSELLKIKSGTIVELDRSVGEPIDILVNGRMVARGEIVIVEDHLGITLTEIFKMDKKKV